MNAPEFILPLLLEFVHCFTTPGFVHFRHFVLARMALLGLPHCVTEALRLPGFHHIVQLSTNGQPQGLTLVTSELSGDSIHKGRTWWLLMMSSAPSPEPVVTPL